MSAAIGSLANLIRTKRESGKKFVVMLGAGASVDAGVPYMSQLIAGILKAYDQGGEGDDYERFDRYWSKADKGTRDSILKKHLDARPSKGHKALARLIKDDWFDAVITFNYDDLLEQALEEADADYDVRVRGELQDEIFADYMLNDEHGARVLKIHGSFKGAKIYLGSLREMRDYPSEISDAFKKITDRDLLVCGYAFGDLCVTRSFTGSDDAGRIYCVDPKGASNELKKLALQRLSSEQTFDGMAGEFDEFFPALEDALSRKTDDEPTWDVPKNNPFKFIEGLYGNDRNMLIGRDNSVAEVIEKLESGNCGFMNVFGEKKSGKSSFVRAGVMPALREKNYEPIYLRCLSSHEDEPVGMLANHPSLSVPLTEFPGAIEALDADNGERFVIILDQFERVAKSILNESGEEAFLDFYDKLYIASRKIACLILVLRDERTQMHTISTINYVVKLFERHRENSLIDGRVELKHLNGEDVAQILATLNGQADSAIPEELRKKYVERMSEDDFTLAHAHTLCHLFVSDYMRDGKPPNRVDRRDVEDKLNLAINACDVMNLIDDLTLKEERILLRNLMKIVSPESKEHIARHVRDNLYHLLTKPGYAANPSDRVVN